MASDACCGRCGSGALLKVPATPSDHSHIVVGERLMHNVRVCRHVCTACGRVEEYVDDPGDLVRLRTEVSRERGCH